MRSMFGVLTKGWPMQPRASQRRSSTRMKTRLGRASAARTGAAGTSRAVIAARRGTSRGMVEVSLPSLRRPLAAGQIAEDELLRVENDVLDSLPLPGVDDVDETVGGLDHGRVAVLSRFALQHQGRLPDLAVGGHGDIERA